MQISLPKFKILGNAKPIKLATISFGSFGVMNDKNMLSNVSLDNIEKLEIKTSLFCIFSDLKSNKYENVYLNNNLDFMDFEQSTNLYYRSKQGNDNIEFSI